jgi:hypothetical protein
MTEWAKHNLELLLIECCSSFFAKALQILDSLVSYSTEVLKTPNWVSVPHKYITIFLLKIYLSNTCLEISNILSFFEVPSDALLIIGAKILLNTTDNEEALNTLGLLNLSDINLNNDFQYNFVSKTLIPFDQILRATTVDLWCHYKEKCKQFAAFSKFKSKLASQDTLKATAVTAAAISEVSEAYDHSQSENCPLKDKNKNQTSFINL